MDFPAVRLPLSSLTSRRLGLIDVQMALRSLLLPVLFAPVLAFAALGDIELTVPVLDSQVILQTRAKFGGAVSSLVFRGKEHLDSADHGRLLQSASSFDGFGECYNPTEGGASRKSNNEEASIVKDAGAKGNALWTSTDMAFFLSPGQAYQRGCGTKKYLKQAVNTEATSGHILKKRLTVGIPGFPNVIEHLVTFYVPDSFSHGVFEASTGYVPKDFSEAIYYDPVRNIGINPGDRQGEQALPVILYTSDKRYAMGVYSPHLPQKGLNVGYGRFSFPDVNKWNCVFRENNVKRTTYEYQCLIVLGTLDQVEETMVRLHNGTGFMVNSCCKNR
jgi:hypothetical protein